MIPGVAGKIGDKQLIEVEKMMKRAERIIGAMIATYLDASVDDVVSFLSEFRQMRDVLKSMYKNVGADAIEKDPSLLMDLPQKKNKEKTTRGGGRGFGR